jgi:hypothetical protein
MLMKLILKLLLVVCLVHYGTLLNAQQIVTTGGDYHQNSSGSISYTIGEVAIETFSKTNNILTQGFHQTNLIAVAINEVKGLDFEISVFPNPTKDIVMLKVAMEKIVGMQYRLFDTNGKVLQNKFLERTETEISFDNLTPATYFIKVVQGKKDLKTFKIVKQ